MLSTHMRCDSESCNGGVRRNRDRGRQSSRAPTCYDQSTRTLGQEIRGSAYPVEEQRRRGRFAAMQTSSSPTNQSVHHQMPQRQKQAPGRDAGQVHHPPQRLPSRLLQTASPPPVAPVDPNAAPRAVRAPKTVAPRLGHRRGRPRRQDPALTPAEKRHGAKLRKGGADDLRQIGNLAQQRQQVESPAVNASDPAAALGKAQALQPLLNRVAAFGKHIEDVIFLASSDEAVQTGLQLYTLLQRRSAIDSRAHDGPCSR